VGAAASVDYVYARTGFGIALSVALGAGGAAATAWEVPLVLVAGRHSQADTACHVIGVEPSFLNLN